MQAMTLRLPDEVHEALRREAYESRRSMNQIILEALERRPVAPKAEALWLSADCQLGYCGTCNDCGHTCHDPYRAGSTKGGSVMEAAPWHDGTALAALDKWLRSGDAEHAGPEAAFLDGYQARRGEG